MLHLAKCVTSYSTKSLFLHVFYCVLVLYDFVPTMYYIRVINPFDIITIVMCSFLNFLFGF
jgi:hypothetical protein